MVNRSFWIKFIDRAWSAHSVIWLHGVRRVGKTFLCRSLPGIEYFDCELPRVRRRMEDPEMFLKSLQGTVVFDEVHRLPNPSEFLKIAADHFPELRIIATGSSTLQVSTRFSDTLTGRKKEILLTPMTCEDLNDFGNRDITHRLLYGGLPPFFLCSELPEAEFQEWIDSYWAKDIQMLFRLERRYSFGRFLELIFINSGGIFEAASYSSPCEISRTTVTNYLAVMEATSIVHVVRPYAARRLNEIVRAPRVYAFDTGFVCYHRGWNELRPEDMGNLWEHYVLNEIVAITGKSDIYYWRDKQGHEIDFVLISRKGRQQIAIECKWSARSFDAGNLRIFRRRYPQGLNWVVSHDIDKPYKAQSDGLEIEFINIENLGAHLKSLSAAGKGAGWIQCK
ncbi:MAG: ATP-binding protein [Candidatus Xenobiia bacterium LiM19]